MSLKDRFLKDNSGAVMAEWVLMTAVLVTVCMVSLTALQQHKSVAAQPIATSATGA